MCDLRREAFVVHEEKVDFSYVADQELLQAVGKYMAGLDVEVETMLSQTNKIKFTDLLVASITNLQ